MKRKNATAATNVFRRVQSGPFLLHLTAFPSTAMFATAAKTAWPPVRQEHFLTAGRIHDPI